MREGNVPAVNTGTRPARRVPKHFPEVRHMLGDVAISLRSGLVVSIATLLITACGGENELNAANCSLIMTGDPYSVALHADLQGRPPIDAQILVGYHSSGLRAQLSEQELADAEVVAELIAGGRTGGEPETEQAIERLERLEERCNAHSL